MVHTSRRNWLVCALLILLLTGHSVSAGEAGPNILFILADDLGWSDLGCYGHPWHETPHIDQLADEGMRFTRAYASAPICSASRASLLTGKTPARLGFEFVTKDAPGRQQRQERQLLDTPPFTLDLALRETTIAEILSERGNQTAFFGKWHLNSHYGGYLGWSPTHGPRQHGFLTAIEDFGSHPYGNRNRPEPQERITAAGQFPPDSMTERAIEYLKAKPREPFFLTVSHFYVHTPVESPCTWLLDKYAEKVPADSPNRNKRVQYAAFVETLDHYVGQLLHVLDEAGLRENTLVIFMSDNGGHPEYTANGPLRGSKWNLYEGGIRVPMICRWPRNIVAGTTCSTPVVGYDLLPTFLDLQPAVRSHAPGDIDGVSLTSLFDDPSRPIERPLYWHFPYYHPERGFGKSLMDIGVNDFSVSQTRPHSAILWKDLKLLSFDEDDRVELYDLIRDPGEQSDLSRSRPEIAETWKQSLEKYLSRVDARMPIPARPETTAKP